MRIAIVGGGISGLATAYYLRRAALEQKIPVSLTLFERSSRLGGVIATERWQGCILEKGPENFVGFKPAIFELVEELGLGGDLLPCNEARRRVYVAADGRLEPLPEGMGFLAPVDFRSFWPTRLIGTRGKLRALLEPLVPPSRRELSVYDFMRRRLGREMTEKITEPLVSAIYGCNIRRVSALEAIPEVHRLEQKYGSLWRGMRRRARRSKSPAPAFFYSLKQGMASLIEALERQLSDVHISKECAPGLLERTPRGYRLGGVEGQPFERVVLATPADATARLLEGIEPEVARLLSGIPYSSTAIVYLGYRRDEFRHPMDGFGFVVTEAESKTLDACTWASSKFPEHSPQDLVLLRCALHDGRRSRSWGTDQELARTCGQEVCRLMGVSSTPQFYRVYRWPRVLPQFLLGHGTRMKRVRSLLARHRGLFLCSAFCGGVGIPDCVASGSRTAREVVDSLR